MKSLASVLLCLGLFSCGAFFGGTREFSFLPVFFMFLCAFVAALFADGAKTGLCKTLSFPPFIAGLAFCAYIGAGQLNIWMESVWKYGMVDIYYKNFCVFLPSGADAIHSNHQTASAIAIMALMLTFCIASLKLLISKPKDCIPYCAALLAGALTCAAAAYLEYFHKDSFFYVWTIYDRGLASRTFGSFFSRNHGVAYALVGMCVLCALWARAVFSRSERKRNLLIKSLLSFSFLCAVIFSLVFSGAFGLLFVAAFILLAIACVTAAFLLKYYGKAQGFGFIAACLLFLAFGISALLIKPTLLPHRVREKIENLSNAGSLAEAVKSTDGGRNQFYGVSMRMIESGGYYNVEKPASQTASKIFFGSGANSYGDVSAAFLSNNPRFVTKQWNGEKIESLSYAHCDPLQIVFEYGVLWGLIFAGFIAYWFCGLVRAKFWRSAFALIMAIPLPAMLLYSCADIVFYNPFLSVAILSTAYIAYAYSRHMRPPKSA